MYGLFKCVIWNKICVNCCTSSIEHKVQYVTKWYEKDKEREKENSGGLKNDKEYDCRQSRHAPLVMNVVIREDSS